MIVCYGDKYPITTEGRIVAAFLMITGVGLFGTLTGLWQRGLWEIKEGIKITGYVEALHITSLQFIRGFFFRFFSQQWASYLPTNIPTVLKVQFDRTLVLQGLQAE